MNTYAEPSDLSSQQPVEVMSKMSFTEHLKTYWDFFFSGKERVPEVDLPQTAVHVNQLIKEEKGVITSWLGHSSVLINIDGKVLLTDPLFERKVSLVGPTRFNKQLPIELKDVPQLDAVLISHDHYDHLNKYSVTRLSKKTGLFIVPTGVAARMINWGIDENKIVELNWWENIQLDEEIIITSTPSQHFSGRGLFDRNKTLWTSYVIASPKHKVFFSGDSGYFDGFKAIGEKFGPFDLTLLECGAYNEKWSNVHMFPEQTIQAHKDLKGKVLHPIHWATFNLSLHSWYEPMDRAVAAAWESGVNIVTPIQGEIVVLSEPRKNDMWWLGETEQHGEEKIKYRLATDVNR